jgi:hypothetical protein
VFAPVVPVTEILGEACVCALAFPARAKRVVMTLRDAAAANGNNPSA